MAHCQYILLISLVVRQSQNNICDNQDLMLMQDLCSVTKVTTFCCCVLCYEKVKFLLSAFQNLLRHIHLRW